MSTDLPIQMLDFPKGEKPRYHHRKLKGDEDRAAVLIRLPYELLDRLDAFASAGYRSRTAEIQRRLEASMVNESIDEHGVIVQHIPPARK
jgi:hypothetical protein